MSEKELQQQAISEFKARNVTPYSQGVQEIRSFFNGRNTVTNLRWQASNGCTVMFTQTVFERSVRPSVAITRVLVP